MTGEAERWGTSVSGTGGLRGSVGLRTVIQWLHLSAAAVIVASAIFMRLIMIPLLQATAPERIPVIVHRFYSIFPWIGLVIFLSTGLLNYLFWLADAGYTPRQSLRTRYVKALVVKVLLANVLLLVSILFGFIPAMDDNAANWLWLPIGLGVVIVLISAGLRRSPS